MTKFEDLFEHLDTHTQVMDSSMSAAMTLSTPQDQVEGLMKQVSLLFTQFLLLSFIKWVLTTPSGSRGEWSRSFEST